MRQTKLQIIDSSLFLYGAIVTFILTITAFFNLKTQNSLITLILFLPVTIYFVIKIISDLKKSLLKLLNIDQKKHPYFGQFSLSTFISQSEPTFLINLALLSLAVALILFRISIEINQ
ncbi:MAG: hypothetical protein UW35_C0028G0032 [Candidatus Collierbacteria bacterium GW2011_GWF2_44_15]|uniref:Uncharacterized protein n=4 Tax=Candidatus Collieribacteriota TaxID=1752725 RepID=A0A0G1HH88_9BACT|nr:MAG: hypothetical protein UW23_C0016G0002 [Candidatus Collierbacteria bacterium GW2011_GWA1_44_12]KKT37766.1 MAG: hypothetical protein UW26_C0025G0005 [Candidatus Collierbacteria bacterium GW2011_GWF1_44_12]KKT45903.1 MAG: hypothetical protein UW35_C0028G0032 [Candidatus Collierbacteria bacterium GW2011_GWF2_44_15]KKU27454.1 MAG: hypothetical protein UX41_C0051G0002 [Candidatus Collierbacteria bacterium GW2011_GWE1_46_18]